MTGRAWVRTSALLFALALMNGTASAAETAGTVPGDNGGRYTLSPVEGGFLRLDTTTGAVSFCSGSGPQWACAPVADNGKPATDQLKALQDEAAKLKEENRVLREALTLEPPLTTPGTAKPAEPPVADSALPTEEDVDKAFDYVEGIVRKFRDRIKRLDEETKPVPKTGTL